MAGIKKAEEGQGTFWENIQEAGNKNQEERLKQLDSNGQPLTDRVEFSSEWNHMEWKDAVNKALDSLREQYPAMHIVIDEGEERENLSALAAGLGRGTHLVVSRKFLERMGSSAEEFAKCSSLLSGMAKKLEGQMKGGLACGVYIGRDSARTWHVEKKQEERKTEQEKSGFFSGNLDKKEENSFTGKIVVKASFNVSKHYSRLAGAHSKGQVHSVLSDVQRNIGTLQMTAVYGDEEERIKAGRALRSLKKLLARGGRKINRLNKEELAALRRKRAEKRQQKEKAEAARLEQKRRRAARSGADNSLVKEGMADEAYIRGYRHYRHLKDYELNQMPPIETLPQDLPGDAGGLAGEAAGFTETEVSVSAAISF